MDFFQNNSKPHKNTPVSMRTKHKMHPTLPEKFFIKSKTEAVSFLLIAVVATGQLLMADAAAIATRSESLADAARQQRPVNPMSAIDEEQPPLTMTAQEMLEIQLERMLEGVLKEANRAADELAASADERQVKAAAIGAQEDIGVDSRAISVGRPSIRRTTNPAGNHRHERRSPAASNGRKMFRISSSTSDQQQPSSSQKRNLVMVPVTVGGGSPAVPSDQLDAIESLNSLLLGGAGLSRLERAYKPRTISTARGFGKRSIPIMGPD